MNCGFYRYLKVRYSIEGNPFSLFVTSERLRNSVSSAKVPPTEHNHCNFGLNPSRNMAIIHDSGQLSWERSQNADHTPAVGNCLGNAAHRLVAFTCGGQVSVECCPYAGRIHLRWAIVWVTLPICWSHSPAVGKFLWNAAHTLVSYTCGGQVSRVRSLYTGRIHLWWASV